MSGTDDLAWQVHSEVEACIGCNDCMLACPLPQAKDITIAELNTAVHEQTIRNPRVIDFVTDCTQCGQCVPACPAELSRANMVLFNKIKVEDAVENHHLMLQDGQTTRTAPWKLDTLCADLVTLPLFTGVDPKDVRRLILSSTLRRLRTGEVLCEHGAYHDRLVVVLYGKLDQYTRASNGEEWTTVSYAPGSFLGEMSVLADQPEAFAVRSEKLSIVLEIPKAAAIRLMDRSPAFRATMDDLYRRRALWTYASSPQALGKLPEQAVRELLGHSTLIPLREGETLFRQGEPPESLYLVRSGFLRVVQAAPGGDRVLVYFREGELFGALGLLLGEAQQVYSVVASTRAEVIRVPGSALFEVLRRHTGARETLLAALESERVVRSPALNFAPVQSGDGRTHLLPLSVHALFEAGLAQGREVLVVDQRKCTYCQGCISACAARHGEARLELRGLQLEHLLFPTACRHCDDPVCLLCSVNGIVRRTSGEISIVTDNCIGCGACAERCPYGNIQMHPVDPQPQRAWSRLLAFLGAQSTPKKAPTAARDVAKKAVKCDLCAEYTDYACVTACPTGAAFRTDLAAAVGGDGAPLRMDAPRHSRT